MSRGKCPTPQERAWKGPREEKIPANELQIPDDNDSHQAAAAETLSAAREEADDPGRTMTRDRHQSRCVNRIRTIGGDTDDAGEGFSWRGFAVAQLEARGRAEWSDGSEDDQSTPTSWIKSSTSSTQFPFLAWKQGFTSDPESVTLRCCRLVFGVGRQCGSTGRQAKENIFAS